MTTTLMLCLSLLMLQAAMHTTQLKEEWHLKIIASKDAAGIILPFDRFSNDLCWRNKTINLELEIKNFEAAGKILTEL